MEEEEIATLRPPRYRSLAGMATGDHPRGMNWRYTPLLPADLLSVGQVTDALKQITDRQSRKCFGLILREFLEVFSEASVYYYFIFLKA